MSNLSFKMLQIYQGSEIIHNPNIKHITMATVDEVISNEYIDDFIISVIKSIRNMKKRPDCSSILDYISKLLSISDITEEILLYRLHYLTDDIKIRNKPVNGRDSYYIIGEIPV